MNSHPAPPSPSVYEFSKQLFHLLSSGLSAPFKNECESSNGGKIWTGIILKPAVFLYNTFLCSLDDGPSPPTVSGVTN